MRGLFGNFNGVPDDDFELRDGTQLPITSTERDIYYSFEESCTYIKSSIFNRNVHCILAHVGVKMY